MLRKDVDPDLDNPTDMQQLAFDTPQTTLASPSIPALPNPSSPIMIDTDASNLAVGVVLLQQQDD